MKVRFSGEDHVFIDNKQFVSLNRVSEIRTDINKELELLLLKNSELAKENEALRVLLRDKLNEEAEKGEGEGEEK